MKNLTRGLTLCEKINVKIKCNKIMSKKVITDEQMKKVLDAFYPGGYGRSTGENDSDPWYIGWFGIDGKTECGLPLEINRDCGSTIVFMWWLEPCCDEYSREELIGYIRGVLSQLLPGMLMDHDTGKWSVSFSYSDE